MNNEITLVLIICLFLLGIKGLNVLKTIILTKKKVYVSPSGTKFHIGDTIEAEKYYPNTKVKALITAKILAIKFTENGILYITDSLDNCYSEGEFHPKKGINSKYKITKLIKEG